MFEQEFDRALLFSAYAKGELDANGQQQLNSWLNENEGNRLLFNSLMNEEELKKKLIRFNTIGSDRMWDKTLQGLSTLNNENNLNNQVPKQHQTIKLWKKISIAASIVIALSAGLYFYIKPGYWGKSEHVVLAVNHTEPGGNRATLSLAGGKTISLSETKTGLVIGERQLTYNDGSSVDAYSELEEKKGETMMLTASTPRGGTYQFILPDGTHVWLNAESKLTFPSKFSRSERKVQLSGEAYFEVAKLPGPVVSANGSKNIPFLVLSKNQQVEVLGTHFNINSYGNEGTVKTTLLEGSVKVSLLSASKAAGSVILNPGQQAVVDGKSEIKVAQADVEQIIAWKNGLFYFKDADLKTILRTFSRWYDMDVIAVDQLGDRKFSGKLYRNVNAHQALQVLKLLGLEFSLEKKEPKIPKNIITKP